MSIELIDKEAFAQWLSNEAAIELVLHELIDSTPALARTQAAPDAHAPPRALPAHAPPR